MRILIDTNRIIAALTKEGTTREILFDESFEFVTPDHTVSEIEEHKDELKKKAKLTEEEFEILLALFLERITIIPQQEYAAFIDKCKEDISDKSDTPHLAVCFAVNAEGIWTHDPHFKEQKKFKVFTNIDMLNMGKKTT